jgi:hypothetical protein
VPWDFVVCAVSTVVIREILMGLHGADFSSARKKGIALLTVDMCPKTSLKTLDLSAANMVSPRIFHPTRELSSYVTLE